MNLKTNQRPEVGLIPKRISFIGAEAFRVSLKTVKDAWSTR